MKRIVLAGLAGGLASFLWSSLAHTVLPLGEAGVSTLANEQAVLDTLEREVAGPGFYLFPVPASDSAEDQAAMVERYRTGPSGVLIYTPPGRVFNFPQLLGAELAATLLAGLLAACVLARSSLSVSQGAVLGAGLGLFTWLALSVSNWNWYDFPAAYVLAEGVEQTIGWLIGGAVIALVAGRVRNARGHAA